VSRADQAWIERWDGHDTGGRGAGCVDGRSREPHVRTDGQSSGQTGVVGVSGTRTAWVHVGTSPQFGTVSSWSISGGRGRISRRGSPRRNGEDSGKRTRRPSRGKRSLTADLIDRFTRRHERHMARIDGSGASRPFLQSARTHLGDRLVLFRASIGTDLAGNLRRPRRRTVDATSSSRRRTRNSFVSTRVKTCIGRRSSGGSTESTDAVTSARRPPTSRTARSRSRPISAGNQFRPSAGTNRFGSLSSAVSTRRRRTGPATGRRGDEVL